MKKIVLLIIFALTLTGCTSMCREFSIQATPGTENIKKNIGSLTGDSVRVTSLKTHYVGTLMQGAINFHNSNSTTQNISYEVTWYDNEGFQINQNPNILIAVLDPNADRQVTVIAPNSRADNMKVKLCMQAN